MGQGYRQKIISFEEKQFRLVEFRYGFVEDDWCEKLHLGIVHSGAMIMEFDGKIVQFKEGDIIHIPQGEKHKHKIQMSVGQTVEVMLFEEA